MRSPILLSGRGFPGRDKTRGNTLMEVDAETETRAVREAMFTDPLLVPGFADPPEMAVFAMIIAVIA